MKQITLAMLAASTMSFAFSGAALAQSKAQPSTTPARGALGSSGSITVAPPTFRTGPATPDSVINQAFPYAMTRLTGYIHTAQTDRADRVGRLIDLGKCDEARVLADAEHDTLMAAKVPQVCEMKRRGLL